MGASAGGSVGGEGAQEAKGASGTKTGAESEDFETFSLKIIHRKNRYALIPGTPAVLVRLQSWYSGRGEKSPQCRYTR